MSTHAAEKHFEFVCPFFENSQPPLEFSGSATYNVVQGIKILLANKNENTDAVFLHLY